MPLKVVVGGAEKLAAKADIYISGAKKRVVRIDEWNGSAWKLVQSFLPTISLSVTPNVFGSANYPGTTLVTSTVATATPTGGAGPYTYAWSRVSGAVLSITAPTNASTSFRTTIEAGGSRTATYRCTVTDTNGLTAFDDVNINLINTGGA